MSAASKVSVIPDLEPHCGSWVCTSPCGEVHEFFTRKNVELAASAGWHVETATAYLARLNKPCAVPGRTQ